MTPSPAISATPRAARRLSLLTLLWGGIVLYLTTIPFDSSVDSGMIAS